MEIIETNWKWNTPLYNRKKTDYIVLHHAAASIASAADVDRWHKQNGWAGIGYHFYVRKNGIIYRGRPIGALGAHVSGKNDVSIGICAEGDYSFEQMPTAQKRAIAGLLDYLKNNCYPRAEIVGHREIGSSDCPGKNYPLAEIKSYKNILNGDDELMSREYEELKAEINALKESQKVYHYWSEIPDWALPTVRKLYDKGIFRGDSDADLNLPEVLMRTMVINDRAGLYD